MRDGGGRVTAGKESESCRTLCDPTDCSPPGSSVHGILQARILEWVAIPFSGGSSHRRAQTPVSCTAGEFFTVWAAMEAWRLAQLTTKTILLIWRKSEYLSEDEGKLARLLVDKDVFFVFPLLNFYLLIFVGAGPCCFTQAVSSCGKLGSSRCNALVSHCSGGFFWAQALEHEDSQQLWCKGSVALSHVESSRARDQTCVPCIGKQILNHWTTRKSFIIITIF